MRRIKYTCEVLAPAVAKSRSYSELMRNLGIRAASGGSHSHLKRRVLEYGLDTSHFKGKAWMKHFSPKNKKRPEEILVVLTGYRRANSHQLRRAMIESGVEFVCKCGQGPQWKGAPLTLEVDHVDEDWRNCRLENLQFLCPNCHAQKGYKPRVCSCGRPISRKATSCPACHLKKARTKVIPKPKISWPNKEDLRRMVWELPVASVASRLGVSGSMVKKKCRALGVDTPPRGYWRKLERLRAEAGTTSRPPCSTP